MLTKRTGLSCKSKYLETPVTSCPYQVHVTRRQLVTFGEQIARFHSTLHSFEVLSFSFVQLYNFFPGNSIERPPSHSSVKPSTQRHLTGVWSNKMSTFTRCEVHILSRKILSISLQQTKGEEDQKSAERARQDCHQDCYSREESGLLGPDQ